MQIALHKNASTTRAEIAVSPRVPPYWPAFWHHGGKGLQVGRIGRALMTACIVSSARHHQHPTYLRVLHTSLT